MSPALAPPQGRRRDVLRVVRQADAPVGIASIADRLDVHPNTVRFHLNALTESGQVELVRPVRHSPGRPPLLYRAVRGMDPTGPRHYRLLAEILAQQLLGTPDARSRAVEAGRAWGERLATSDAAETSAPAAPVDRLVELLHGLGFAPERQVTDGQEQIGLRHCPFLELAETGADVVCPVHLGLMRGALDAWDAGTTVDRLNPFVEPDLCVAQLGPRPRR
ncbi:metalloregulator ArsR/SmtB family transcription factor [Jiangella sp. DSM 45060]|uniref:helix-turn-helix transcriptional regulator n=1 Tax=Jiangella sp. DSM 45060 TaxID=1798224 RepID=UPI00087D38E1|nr:helix-turn-helix domain-containing protein [Jiangella sp. DSM 45060]SDT70919.1 Predicted transcriptional regulator, ArsR family [Jiangella sp. DSM 45060]